MLNQETLTRVVNRHAELGDLLARPGLTSDLVAKYSKEYSDLTPVTEAIGAWRAAEKNRDDLEKLLTDPEMKDMAQEELQGVRESLPQLERAVLKMLLPKDENDERSAILEVRAGTGGQEAALFAAELFDMYRKYAQKNRWQFEVMSLAESDLGGLKEGVAEITGKGVYARMKFESGVHRVQRVPATEAQGRVHTSAATVAVLPEAEDTDIKIEEKDLQIDVYRSSGAGGQHVNTTDSAVRITHIPTGVVVACQEERSQHKNKAKAMKYLRTRLYEADLAKKAASRAADRKSMVGSGDRSERIRTYNFPQSRVTEHRVNLTLYKIDEVMAGDALDEIIEALLTQDEAEKLAEFS